MPVGLLQAVFTCSLLPKTPMMHPSSSARTTLDMSTSPLPVPSSTSKICRVSLLYQGPD